jgi:hypothetical protein
MSAAIDYLQREVRELKKLLNARDSGIPESFVVMVKGEAAKTPEGIAAAVKKALAPYGLETAEEALAAGCTVKVAPLPWLREDARQIPKRPTADNLGSANCLAKTSESNTEAIVGSLSEGDCQ